MKTRAFQIFMQFPFAALCVVLTTLFVLLATILEHCLYRKATVISDSLYVKVVPVEIGRIEALLVTSSS